MAGSYGKILCDPRDVPTEVTENARNQSPNLPRPPARSQIAMHQPEPDTLNSEPNSEIPTQHEPSTTVQKPRPYLLHLQTAQVMELPPISSIFLGKPNDRHPPQLDLSNLPDADIVSRVHAEIVVEEDDYFIEDKGSSNGTFINHVPLPPGDRHHLLSGDLIAFGKEDKVTFIFKT